MKYLLVVLSFVLLVGGCEYFSPTSASTPTSTLGAVPSSVSPTEIELSAIPAPVTRVIGKGIINGSYGIFPQNHSIIIKNRVFDSEIVADTWTESRQDPLYPEFEFRKGEPLGITVRNGFSSTVVFNLFIESMEPGWTEKWITYAKSITLEPGEIGVAPVVLRVPKGEKFPEGFKGFTFVMRVSNSPRVIGGGVAIVNDYTSKWAVEVR